MNKLDIFGSRIQLLFQGRESYHTKLGQIFTIVTSIAIIIKFYSLVNFVYQRYEPMVISNERAVEQPEPFNMNNQSIQYAFAMLDPITYQPYIDPSIYKISVTQYKKVSTIDPITQVKSETIKNEDIPIQRCIPENFQNLETRDYFLNLDYKNLFCILPEAELQIEGAYNQEKYSYFTMKVTACKQDKNCKNSEEIDQMMNNGIFELYFSDSIVDPSRKDEPFLLLKREVSWRIHKQYPKDIYVFYKNNYVESDFGWIFSDIQTKRYPAVDDTLIDVLPSDFQGYYLSVSSRFDRGTEKVYKRAYKTIGNILSEVGGFAQVFLIIGYMIVRSISQLQLNKEIINEAFNFSPLKRDKQKKESPRENLENSITNKCHFEVSKDKKEEDNNQRFPIIYEPSQKNFSESTFNNMIFQISSQTHLKIDDQSNNLLKDKIRKLSPKFDTVNPQSQQGIRLSSKNIINQTVKKDTIQKNNNSRNSISEGLNFQIIKSKDKFDFKSIQKEDCVSRKQLIKSIIQSPGKEMYEIQNQQQIDQIKESFQFKNENKDHKITFSSITEKQFKKILKSVTNGMKLSIFEYVKFFFWPFGEMKRKKKIIDYSIEKLYYHLDALNIVKKLLEVDKLKRILMDQDQIKLFECLPKPIIDSEEIFEKKENNYLRNLQQDILYQDKRTELEKMKDAYLSYHKVNEKQYKSSLDQKLLLLLDKNMKDLFEKDQIIENDEEKNLALKESEYNIDQNQVYSEYKLFQQNNIQTSKFGLDTKEQDKYKQHEEELGQIHSDILVKIKKENENKMNRKIKGLEKKLKLEISHKDRISKKSISSLNKDNISLSNLSQLESQEFLEIAQETVQNQSNFIMNFQKKQMN